MTAHCHLDLQGELTMTVSLSRPRVSNDNTTSESQFKTLRYQQDYPGRFDSDDHAVHGNEGYVRWYNRGHHHSSLAGFTLHQVFSGEYLEIAHLRQAALDEMYAQHPERFSKGRSNVPLPPAEVCINPVPEDADQATIEKGVNFPALPRAITKAI
jgi:putative transposase